MGASTTTQDTTGGTNTYDTNTTLNGS
jgi:hypothetical protein